MSERARAGRARGEACDHRTADLLAFIRAYQAERGYGPTVREIQAALGLSSPSLVQRRLDRLTEGGLLRPRASLRAKWHVRGD